ncbi:MAG: LysR family transcriptional regulator [Burkholderiaceae bacterium]|nr:LysR family transcriptional regulator [Burkholderiaceae bacterium]
MRYRKATLVAERLSLTQSTISHALNRLRQVFGDELFIRRPNGFEPTARAVELEPVLRKLVEDAQQALKPQRAEKGAPGAGMLRIGGSDYSCAVFAAPLLQRVSELAPEVMLAIRPMMRGQALDALIQGELDLGIGYFWGEAPGVASEVIYKETYAVLARADHPGIVRGKMGLDAYSDAGHVMVSYEGDAGGLVDEALQDLGRRRRIVATVPFFLPALHALAASDLILTAPRRLGETHARRYGLAVLDPPVKLRSFTVSLAWHERTADSRLRLWVVKQLKNLLRQ